MDKIVWLVVVCISGQAFACSSSGWSKWINEHNSTTAPFPEELHEAHLSLKGGDYENKDNLPQGFCVKGHGGLTKIECVSAVDGKNYTEAQKFKPTGLVCDVNRGFKCKNRLTDAKACLDYKVRFYCDCKSPITVTTAPNPTKSVRRTGGSGGVTGTLTASGGGASGGAGVIRTSGGGFGSASKTTARSTSGGVGIHVTGTPGAGRSDRSTVGSGGGGFGGPGAGSGSGNNGVSQTSTHVPGNSGAAANTGKDNGASGLIHASQPVILLFAFTAWVLRMRGF